MKFKIGDIVRVKIMVDGYRNPNIQVGDKGRIISKDDYFVEIKFPQISYTWWLPIDTITSGRKQPLKKRICLKIKEMEDRHKVFLENKYGKLAIKA